MIDKAGQKFGNLTVVSDGGNSQILCLCDCGREQLFPRAVTKPTYRGRRMCNYCRGADCVICGKRIPQTTGRVAITCSPEHARQHATNKEKARYQRIKGSGLFKSTRAAYLNKMKERFESEPGFYMVFRMRHAACLRKWREQMPAERRGKHLARQNELRRQWLTELRADPVRYQQFRERYRVWYASLLDEDYSRIFGRERKYRKSPYR